jgi:hypothetical protein
MQRTPEILLFVGRLHPLAVHLPIGFLVLLVVLETLSCSRRFRGANASAGYILALLVPAAWVSALCGWLLSRADGYDPQLLATHKWAGIGTAAFCALSALLYRLDLRKAYRLCLYVTAILLAVAGHLGGSLTHGSDYLARHAPGLIRSLFGQGDSVRFGQGASNKVAQKSVFVQVIQPILQARCIGCHNPEKRKSGLSMDSFDALLQGGRAGPVLIPGRASASPMVKRLLLPPDHEDHMPPDGKPQPTAEDIALLQWWIDAGASADKTVGDLNPLANIRRILDARFSAAK